MWISKQSPILSRGTRFGYSMDTIITVWNLIFSGDGKEFTKVSLADGQAESHLHWPFIRIWLLLWRFIMESPNFNTSSIRDEWDFWKRGTQSRRRNVCCICCNQAWLKWWADSTECYCFLRNVQDLLADGKIPYERRFGEPFQGPVTPCASMIEYHPISAKDQ